LASIKWQILLKIPFLVYKVLNTSHPPYLTEQLLQCHKSARSTCSSASHLLSVPQHNFSFGAHAFHVAVPKIRNSTYTSSHPPIPNMLSLQTSS